MNRNRTRVNNLMALFLSVLFILQILHNGKVEKYCGERNSGNGNHPGNRSILIPTTNIRLTLQINEVNKGPYPPVGFSAFYQATGD